MFSQNILQQIKNSHSLLPASGGQGEAFPKFNCWLYHKLSRGMLRPYGYYGYAIAFGKKFNKQKQVRYL